MKRRTYSDKLVLEEQCSKCKSWNPADVACPCLKPKRVPKEYGSRYSYVGDTICQDEVYNYN